MLQIEQENTNLSMESWWAHNVYGNIVSSILDTYAPLQKLIKISWSSRQNPGLLLPFRNLSLLKTTYEKSHNFKRFSSKKTQLHMKYKDYRNLLCTILKKTKTNYYSQYFESNWNNIKNAWKGSKSIFTIKNISA